MDLPTLRQLEYAVALGEHEHFGRAAAAVHLSQAGLSSQIRELEKRLGVELFERSTRQVRPSAAGRELIERSHQIIREVSDLAAAVARHQGTVRGELRVSAIPTMAPYLLPALVKTIGGQWPGVDLNLQEQQTATMVSAIECGQVDLGLLAIPVDTGTLHVEPILHEDFYLALPEGHDLSGSDPLPVEELADLAMLLLPEGHCLRDQALSACDIAGRVEHNEVQAASLSTLTQMVASGIGVTLLPATAIAVEARSGNGVTTRPLCAPAPGRTIALAWRESDPRGDLYSELLEQMVERTSKLVHDSGNAERGAQR